MLLVESSKGVITKNKTIIKEVTKYVLSKDSLLNGSSDIINTRENQIRKIYRRFIRLAPFISEKRATRSKYVEYLRKKFRISTIQKSRDEDILQENLDKNEILHPDVTLSLRSLHLIQLLLSDNKEVAFFGKRLVTNILEKKVPQFGKGHNKVAKISKDQKVDLFDYTLNLFNKRNNVNF